MLSRIDLPSRTCRILQVRSWPTIEKHKPPSFLGYMVVSQVLGLSAHLAGSIGSMFTLPCPMSICNHGSVAFLVSVSPD